jgi:hypothetical protein
MGSDPEDRNEEEDPARRGAGEDERIPRTALLTEYRILNTEY